MGETGERGEIGGIVRSSCLATHGMHMETLDQLKWEGKSPGVKSGP